MVYYIDDRDGYRFDKPPRVIINKSTKEISSKYKHLKRENYLKYLKEKNNGIKNK